MKRVVLMVLMVALLCGPACADDKLLHEVDFSYVGAFDVPPDGDGSYQYGGRALAYDSDNDSLFISGYQYAHGYVGEITIPTPSLATSKASLPDASYRQGTTTNFWEVTGGNVADFGASGATCGYPSLRGLLVYNGYLYGATTSNYDSAPVCSFLSHFKASKTLSSSSFDGYYGLNSSMAGYNGRFVGGGMSIIPESYQTQLGGKCLTGAIPESIISTRSHGPAIAAFDPESLGTINASSAGDRGACVMLVAYPNDHATLDEGDWHNANDNYSSVDNPQGGVIPEGSRSLVMIGLHGTTYECYGTGEFCEDAANPNEGNHNYPYYSWVWLYDIGNADGSNTTGNTVSENGYVSGTMYNTLTAVKLGIIDPWDVLPYETFALQLSPFSQVMEGPFNAIYGITIDPTSNKIYAVRYNSSTGPLIEVYQIDAEAAPPTLSNVTISGGSFR